ncbi:MAG: PilZ domain-containing protein [Polyangia bacterium]
MAKKEDERRSSPRLRLRRGVSVTLRGISHETHTINVSTGGLSIELVEAPERGTRGNVLLALTEGPSLDLLVEVRWISPLSTQGPGGIDTRYLVGLQFLTISPEALERLTTAIAGEDEEDDDDELFE